MTLSQIEQSYQMILNDDPCTLNIKSNKSFPNFSTFYNVSVEPCYKVNKLKILSGVLLLGYNITM